MLIFYLALNLCPTLLSRFHPSLSKDNKKLKSQPSNLIHLTDILQQVHFLFNKARRDGTILIFNVKKKAITSTICVSEGPKHPFTYVAWRPEG